MADNGYSRKLVGRYVRIETEVTTLGGTVFERGEVCRIFKVFKGLWLERAVRCETCCNTHYGRAKEIPLSYVTVLAADVEPPDEDDRLIMRLQRQIRKERERAEVAEAHCAALRKALGDLDGHGIPVETPGGVPRAEQVTLALGAGCPGVAVE